MFFKINIKLIFKGISNELSKAIIKKSEDYLKQKDTIVKTPGKDNVFLIPSK